MRKDWVQPPAEVTQELQQLFKLRGQTSALADRAKVNTTTLARIRKGSPVTVASLNKVVRALQAQTLPAPTSAVATLPDEPAAVNGMRHLERYTAALMEGMEFMRLQVLRYLNSGER